MKATNRKLMDANPSLSPIFICGQARSGTTLMQRLINSTGIALIHGEHLGILKGVADSYFDFFENKKMPEFCSVKNAGTKDSMLVRLRDAKGFPALVNGLTGSAVMESYRQFVYHLINRSEFKLRWGFKEIRYCCGQDRVVPFLHSIFPKAQFVFTIRHPVDQISSLISCGWWQCTPDEAAGEWVRQTRSMLRYCHDFPNSAVMVRYEDFIAKDEQALRELFLFLNLRYGDKQRDILFKMKKTGMAPDKSPIKKKMGLHIARRCSSPEMRLLYAELD